MPRPKIIFVTFFGVLVILAVGTVVTMVNQHQTQNEAREILEEISIRQSAYFDVYGYYWGWVSTCSTPIHIFADSADVNNFGELNVTLSKNFPYAFELVVRDNGKSFKCVASGNLDWDKKIDTMQVEGSWGGEFEVIQVSEDLGYPNI